MAASTAAAHPGCAAELAAAKPAIDHANNDWVRAMKAGDAAAIADAYAEDGLFVLPDGSLLKGRAAVQQLYAARGKAAAGIVGGGIDSERTVCGADGLLYEWGQGRLAVRGPDGRVETRGGPYLTVWKRVDGGWKIVRNLAF